MNEGGEEAGLLRSPRETLPGLADAGLASLATFAVGIAAARLLSQADLGAYAIFFSGFVLAGILPTSLVLQPLEIWLVKLPRAERLCGFGRNLRWGLLAAALSVLPYGGVALLIDGNTVASSTLIAFWATGTLAGLLSPLQDHLRRLFHLAGWGKFAAYTSLVQFLVVIGAILVLLGYDVSTPWVPLGALIIANAVSLVAAIGMAQAGVRATNRQGSAPQQPQLQSILGSGRWLLVQGVVTQGSGFAVVALVGAIAGLVALGQAEAARIVVQPLMVLGGGLMASLGPRSMEAGAARDVGRARALRRRYWQLLVPLGVLYLGYVSWNVPLNLMRNLVPIAYDTKGLVLVTGIGALVAGMSFVPRSELLGMGHVRDLTWIDGTASAVHITASGLAAVRLGSFSLPAGAIVSSVVRTVLRTRQANRALASPQKEDG